MKKIILLGCFILSIVSCKAQIIPIEEEVYYIDNQIEVTEGTYFKDVNNLLDKFVGTWTGVYDNKNYEFIITETTIQTEVTLISYDELRIRYKITDASGTVIEDTTQLPNDSFYVINGTYMSQTGSYISSYNGYESNCGQSGDVYISVSNSTLGEMWLFLFPDVKPRYSDCTVEQVLPTDTMILTKQ